jgi:hypothetical protein
MQTPDASYDAEPLPGRGRVMPRVRRRILDEMDAPVTAGAGLMGGQGPASGNTGIGGASAAPITPAPSAPAAPKPFAFAPDSVSTLLRKYEHTPDGLKKAFAENPDLAGVSQIGGSKGDKILDPTTGRWIDVITAAGLGGTGWQWLDDVPGQGGDAQADPSGRGGVFRGMDPYQVNLIDKVRESIMQLMEGGKGY